MLSSWLASSSRVLLAVSFVGSRRCRGASQKAHFPGYMLQAWMWTVQALSPVSFQSPKCFFLVVRHVATRGRLRNLRCPFLTVAAAASLWLGMALDTACNLFSRKGFLVRSVSFALPWHAACELCGGCSAPQKEGATQCIVVRPLCF